MTLFHETLNDAIRHLKQGDIAKAKEILTRHEQAELKEESYIEGSLYSIRQFLKNYISHLYMAIGCIDKPNPSQQERQSALEHIQKCKDNSAGFEDATKELLKREEVLLE